MRTSAKAISPLALLVVTSGCFPPPDWSQYGGYTNETPATGPETSVADSTASGEPTEANNTLLTVETTLGSSSSGGSECDALGGQSHLAELANVIASNIYDDWRINGPFLDSTFQDSVFRLCLQNFLAPAFQCSPQRVPPCTTFLEALTEASFGGIDTFSAADAADLREDIVLALASVPEAQSVAIQAALDAESDLVKDAQNDQSAYQRMGRQAALRSMVSNALTEAKTANELSAYFADVEEDRFVSCFARFVGQKIGGSMTYAAESTLGGHFKVPCLAIDTFHTGVPHDAFLDFVMLMGKHAPGSDADVMSLSTALAELCESIVDDKNACFDNTQERTLEVAGMFPILKGPSETCVKVLGIPDPALTTIRVIKSVAVAINHPQVGHISIEVRAPVMPPATAQLMSKPGGLPEGFPANLAPDYYLTFVEEALCDYTAVGSDTADEKSVCSPDDPTPCECMYSPKQPLSWLTPDPVPLAADWDVCVSNSSDSTYGHVAGVKLLVTATKY